ncbi:hypothetical protein ACS0TY_024946 [Phlomoides rotata]
MMGGRKQSSCIVLRPICFFIILMLVVLCLAGLLMPLWMNRVTKIEKKVGLIANNTNGELFSRIKKTAALFSPFNASSINLARILTSSLGANNLNFSKIISKISSPLFQALSTIPNLSQISYIGVNGLLFAYYKEGDQPYALYSNSTITNNYTWYKQPVNRDTGNLYGEAMKFLPSDVVNASWFQQALKSKNGYASVGSGWADSPDIVFDIMLLSSVGLDGKGVLSLGFPMAPLIHLMVDDIAFYNGSLFLATMDGNVLTQGLPNARMIFDGTNQVSFRLLDNDHLVGNVTCQSDQEEKLKNNVLSFSGRKYTVVCSLIETAGLQLVYVVALPPNEIPSIIHSKLRLPYDLLIVMVCGVVTIICIFVCLIIKAARREMYLCGALINQMEATQQSERKSMNKSLAFASASHDIRASLAGICGLIEICRNEVNKRDHLLTSLMQMEACTRDLLGILNTILDTSKIESGKMQLEEEEFDVEELLEDVVDLYHPVGMRKGVDVILDPYDGSILKSSRVKGDRGRLKQVLSNLLSNAVKFTSNGHVAVRAKARKPSLESEVFDSNEKRSLACCLLFKIGRANGKLDVVNTMIQREDPNCMEFIFEVNDTGKGIPKEEQKSVFENYIQVKETALRQEGTGLGLGIVQSLVRLMGGEIKIVDKEAGERGSCFRFNVFLSITETGNSRRCDIEINGDNISGDSSQVAGPFIRIHSPKPEGSQVILFIESAKRSSLLRAYLQRLGIKVHLVRQHQHLSLTLKKIKRKQNLSRFSSSGTSRSDGFASSTRSRDVPLSALDGTDTVVGSSHKRANARLGFVLIVIDTRAGPFREISRAVAEFRRDLSESCYSRVVWLDKTDVNSTSFDGLDEDKLPSSDIVISKPFHGLCLHQTIKLLPEFGGQVSDNARNVVVSVANEIEEVGDEEAIRRKPLTGKRVLVADDDPIGRKIATFVASQLGAIVFSSENGDSALKLVCTSLSDHHALPFDCVLMDCEMPVMDGGEATARIREAEKGCGVHTPIIALTAHKKGEEIQKMIQAGVDAYITKPLNKDNFLTAISQLTL